MEFKDVAHLYIGCKIETDIGFSLANSSKYTTYKELTIDNISDIIEALAVIEWDRHCKPILRPLSDMTDKEEQEWLIGKTQHLFYPTQFKILLSQHFDLFGLIASGQAIDATTLTPNPYK